MAAKTSDTAYSRTLGMHVNNNDDIHTTPFRRRELNNPTSASLKCLSDN